MAEEDIEPVVVSSVGPQLAAAIAAVDDEDPALLDLIAKLGLVGVTPSPGAIVAALLELEGEDKLPIAAVAGAAAAPIQDTAANFAAGDAFPDGQTTLLPGQIGHETDTGKIKFGVGSTVWSALPYSGAVAAIIKTAALHVSENTTLDAGQPGIESDTGKEKLGAGSWNGLAYRTEPYVAPVALSGAEVDLDVAHDRKRLRFSGSTPVLTIKAQANVAFPENFAVPLASSANALTITAAAGVTLNGQLAGSVLVTPESAGGAVRLQRIAENIWLAHTGGVASTGALVAALVAAEGDDRLPGEAVKGVTLAPIDKTAAEHATDDTELAAGQRGRETDTGREKVGPAPAGGDWNSLPYANGDTWGNLAADAATERAEFAGMPVLAGFNPDGSRRVTPEVPEALASPADAIAGGEATVTGDTMRDLRKVRTIAIADGVCPVELPKIADGKMEFPLNFQSSTDADFYLKMLTLPAALDDGEIRGAGSVRNTHAANTIRADLPHPVVPGPNSASHVIDADAAMQVWEEGSSGSLRSIPPGQSRLFDYRVRNGFVIWRPRPLNLMSQVVDFQQRRRVDLTSYNLPSITDGWYSIIIVTINHVEAAEPPIICDHGSVEQIETHYHADISPSRIEGILTQGGNVTFDSAPVAGQGRVTLTRRHNFKPVSVGSLMHAATYRDKPFANSTTTVLWAGATIPDGEECYIFTGALARGSAATSHPPRSGLGRTAFLPQPIASAFVAGLTDRPVTAWAQEDTAASINQEGTSFAIPLIVWN